MNPRVSLRLPWAFVAAPRGSVGGGGRAAPVCRLGSRDACPVREAATGGRGATSRRGTLRCQLGVGGEARVYTETGSRF
ncbi:hypothetical protein NDU88_004463 [Pleurodeles waltl]|uniref:Secreted protein n=1 Tax=Pleurodeles waltl TaxID=8319 RepID=A0AAV7QC17_PLEWA|nr:hypothetical protein NDU88_004463 [Pleurodeles waltl]